MEHGASPVMLALSRKARADLRALDIHTDAQLRCLEPKLRALLPEPDRAILRKLEQNTAAPVDRIGPIQPLDQDDGRVVVVHTYPNTSLQTLPPPSTLPLLRRWSLAGLPLKQGHGQCAAYAAATALGLAHGLRRASRYPDPVWLYENSETPENRSRGRSMLDLAKLLNNRGFVRMGERQLPGALMPIRHMVRRPRLICLTRDAQTTLRIAADLCMGRIGSPTPLVVALDISENWRSCRTGMLRRPEPSIDQPLGAHAVLLLGLTMIEGRGYAVIGNSWGKEFGGESAFGLPSGVALMTVEQFAQAFLDGMAMITDPINAWAVRRSAHGSRPTELGILWRVAEAFRVQAGKIARL